MNKMPKHEPMHMTSIRLVCYCIVNQSTYTMAHDNLLSGVGTAIYQLVSNQACGQCAVHGPGSLEYSAKY